MKTLILDLDGTMYRGTEIIESAKNFVDHCIEKQIPFLFMSNNSMRTAAENAEHMLKMGYEGIQPEMFYNSAMASAEYVRANYQGDKAWYIGQNGLLEALKENGFEITDDHPDFLFVGLDKRADYTSYSKALTCLLDGAKLIGTNKDRILAKPGGFELGNGSIVALFEYAINQKSPDIAKPSPVILELCLKHYGLNKDDVILVGDNLETDIMLGKNAGVRTIFVETGIHTRKDIERLGIVPDQIVHELTELKTINF